MMDIKLTVVERIILRNQYLILKKLDPDEAEQYEKLIAIVEDGYEHDFGQLAAAFSGDTMPEKDFAEVIDILDMYSALQRPRKKLGDKAAETEKAAVAFPGFDGDGNDERESRYMGYARFLVKNGRFADVELREKDFNSHIQRLPQYSRIVQRWKTLEPGVEPGQRHGMTAEQMRQVLHGDA